MTCKMALELVEPIASGDLEPDAAARAHFESCPQCASALATARRLEAILAGRAAPAAPERFATSVLQRIRRERWRAEQHVDRLFNVAIAVALLLITGGILALMNMSDLMTAATGTWSTVSRLSGEFARQAAPVMTTYIAAAGLLLSVLLMWWWADRRLWM
jgi:anti-sigma factor RsiW